MTHSLYLFGTALQAEVLFISLPETSSLVMVATLSIAFQAGEERIEWSVFLIIRNVILYAEIIKDMC